MAEKNHWSFPEQIWQLNYVQGAEGLGIQVQYHQETKAHYAQVWLGKSERQEISALDNSLQAEIVIKKPDLYIAPNPHFDSLQAFLFQVLGAQVEKQVEYYEGARMLVFSYYLYDSEWKQSLLVCDVQGRPLYQQEIQASALKAYPSFQVLQDRYLVFIQNKTELVVYELD